MRLQGVAQRYQLRILFWHLLLHAPQRLRCANASHHILSLSVGEILAEHFIFASPGIAREADPGSTVVALVTEDHGADIDSGPVRHVGCDVKLSSIVDGPLAFPRAKY